ncbi:MAG TPA: hypothetical protein ENH35_04030 [Candidatus Moranbacteria bacterium]|nr:hypothetical protein [Candidatus Moranbacteria bacterium]
MAKNSKDACLMPTDGDIEWVVNSVQRHTGGPDAWFEQNKDKLSVRDFARIFIATWEAGRGEAEGLKHLALTSTG